MKKNITETKFWDLYTLAGNGIMVNLMFLICSIPIVTMGPAWCGLYSALRYAIRGEQWATGFKAGIKTRFWRMLIAWTVILIPMVVSIIRIMGFVVAIEEKTAVMQEILPLLIGDSIFLLFLIMFSSALILLNVYIPTDVIQWLKNGVTLIFRNPIGLLIVAIMMLVPVAIALYIPVTSFAIIMIFVAMYFTVVVFVSTLVMKNSLVRIKDEMAELEEAEDTEIEETDDEEI